MEQHDTATPVQSEYLDREQAGIFINMSPAFIRKMERLGAGPERIRVGKCVRYTRQSLRAFMEARKVKV